MNYHHNTYKKHIIISVCKDERSLYKISLYTIELEDYTPYHYSLTVWSYISRSPVGQSLYMHSGPGLSTRHTIHLQYNIFWQWYFHTYSETFGKGDLHNVCWNNTFWDWNRKTVYYLFRIDVRQISSCNFRAMSFNSGTNSTS